MSRVLFFSSCFPRPKLSGHCPYNVSLCEALAEEHRVTAVVPVPWTDFSWGSPVPQPSPTVPVHYARYYHVPRLGRGRHDRVMADAAQAASRRAVTELGGIDWVLSYWTYPDAAAALRIAREQRVPLVTLAGGSDVLLLRPGSRLAQQTADTLRAAQHVITVSEDLASKIAELGVPRDRVTVMPRGVDSRRFTPGDVHEARRRVRQPDAPTIVWAGRMVAVKNLKGLVEGLSLLRRRVPAARLVLVGDGPCQPDLRRQVEQLGIGDGVHFAGNIRQSELADWYRAADVFALPSWSEGTPNVLLEAMACGVPFVGSRVGGIPDLMVDGVDECVTPGNVEELTDALARRLFVPARRNPPDYLASWQGVARLIASKVTTAEFAHA